VNRARKNLVTLAKKLGVELRLSYARLGKLSKADRSRFLSAPEMAAQAARLKSRDRRRDE
jgi:hypothetical protein